MADPIFDIALLKRFTDDPQAVLVDITPSDTLLIRNAETGSLMRLPFSVLANAVSGALVGYLKAANNLSDVANAGTARTNLGATTLGSNLFTVPNPGAVRFPRFNADNTVSTLNAADFRTAIGAGTSSTSGTVTSVGVSVPTGLSVSGSPVTSSGTIAISYSAGYSLPSNTSQAAWDAKEPGITAGTTAQYWRGDKSWQTLNTAAVAESTNLYYTDARVRAAVLTGYSAGTNTALAATDTLLAALGKVQGQINAREGSITAGTTSQYWRGDKSWQTLDKSAVGLGNVTNDAQLKAASNLADLNNAGTARTNLGATTLGSNLFTIPNPGAVRFPRFNADNTISALDAASFRSAIGAGTSSTTGTVTSVGVSVPTGLSVSGSPVTSSGTIAISYSAGYSIPSDAAQSAWSAKEPGITAGTTAQYWRGDKTWQTLDKSAVGLGNVENTALSTWAGSTNLTTLGTLVNALRLNNAFNIWDTAGGAAAGKEITWRMNVSGGNSNSILARIQPSSYTSFQGTTQNVVYLYAGSWNNNDDPGLPVITMGSTAGNIAVRGSVTANGFEGNASTATKLATARTIAGVSFDGSANINIPFSGLSSKPTTLAGYGITDAAAKTNPSLYGGMIYQGQSITLTALNTPVQLAGSTTISGILRFRDKTLGGAAVFICDPNGGIATVVNQITGLTVAYNSGAGYILEAKVTSGTVSRILNWSMIGAG